MSMYKLLLYRNADEFHQFQAKSPKEIFPFSFGGTKNLLEINTAVVIDISALVRHLLVNKNDQTPAEVNLYDADENTEFLIHESVADSAIELFPYYFEEKEYLFEAKQQKRKKQQKREPLVLYTYGARESLEKLFAYCENKKINIISFPQANEVVKDTIESSNTKQKICIDITSLAYAIEDNKNLVYLAEQFFALYKKDYYIIRATKADKILEMFPFYFRNQEKISELFPELELDEQEEEESIRCIVDSDIGAIEEYFEENIIGHNGFKREFYKGLKNFKRLFSAGETPIYSVFLFGKSGIGKTEVARVLNAALAKENTLAKINFQNYSSQDALNSLIGSPAGYIGCEHGELSEKISKSKVGVLLCDEFEKTTRPVYSFFLELLEEGKFTDSLAREYDMNGYVVIFTSNILNETEYKKIIPQELQTRFDLVCEFEAPSRNDKKEFIELLLKRAEEKYPEFDKLLEADIAKLKNMNNYPYESLREIKKAFNNLLMECFSQYDESMA